MNKKVFISQPMRGKSNEEIKQEREELVKELKENGYEEIDSILSEDAPKNDFEGVFYLGHSLILLSQTDVAYFMRGWDEARGCKIEHEVAVNYGIPILKD